MDDSLLRAFSEVELVPDDELEFEPIEEEEEFEFLPISQEEENEFELVPISQEEEFELVPLSQEEKVELELQPLSPEEDLDFESLSDEEGFDFETLSDSKIFENKINNAILPIESKHVEKETQKSESDDDDTDSEAERYLRRLMGEPVTDSDSGSEFDIQKEIEKNKKEGILDFFELLTPEEIELMKKSHKEDRIRIKKEKQIEEEQNKKTYYNICYPTPEYIETWYGVRLKPEEVRKWWDNPQRSAVPTAKRKITAQHAFLFENLSHIFHGKKSKKGELKKAARITNKTAISVTVPYEEAKKVFESSAKRKRGRPRKVDESLSNDRGLKKSCLRKTLCPGFKDERGRPASILWRDIDLESQNAFIELDLKIRKKHHQIGRLFRMILKDYPRIESES